MKILVVSQYFYPEAFRINDLCFHLQQEGHQVTVLTGYPNYPEGYIYPEYRGKRIKREVIQNVDVIRVNMSQRRKNAVCLFLNYVTYALSAGIKSFFLDKDYDVVFVFEVSPITQIIPAWLYKIRCKAPVIVNCQDIWPDVIKVYGINENSAIFAMVRKFSGWLYRKADVIVTSSPGFNGYLKEVCNVPERLMHYIPNFAEDYYLQFGDVTNQDGKRHLLFAGNIGKAQNLDIVVKALSEMKDDIREKLQVDILGDGSYLQEFQALVATYNLEREVKFYGRKPPSELQGYYEMADGFLLTLEGNSPVSMTIPSKLQGYMGAGKPILAAINGGARDVIVDSNCGKCVPAGDADGLRYIIEEFVKKPEQFRRLGVNGRDYFLEKFTIHKYISTLEDVMEATK